MDEYIKKSEAIKAIRENPSKMAMYTAKAICAIENLPTADVVPKTEVEKLQKELEIWKQNRFNLFQRLGCYEMAKQKVASEIFAEIYDRLLQSFPAQSFIDAPCTTHDRIFNMVAELKKKYAEGKQ